MAEQAQEDPGHRDNEELCRRSGLLQEYPQKVRGEEKSHPDQRDRDRIAGAKRLLTNIMLGVSSLSSLPSCSVHGSASDSEAVQHCDKL